MYLDDVAICLNTNDNSGLKYLLSRLPYLNPLYLSRDKTKVIASSELYIDLTEEEEMDFW